MILSLALTDSSSHAIKKYPLVGIPWIIRWLLGEAHIVTGLNTDHRQEIEGGFTMLTSTGSNILTIMVCSPWVGMVSLVTFSTQLDISLELNCTTITRKHSSIIADKASWSG